MKQSTRLPLAGFIRADIGAGGGGGRSRAGDGKG